MPPKEKVPPKKTVKRYSLFAEPVFCVEELEANDSNIQGDLCWQ
jgi:hypothetical protein